MDFDALRAEYDRERSDPIAFRLGGEDFACLDEPMFGDIVELYEAPEVDVNEQAAILAIRTFIKRLLTPEDRDRFDKVLYSLPGSHASILIKIAEYLSEQFTRPLVRKQPVLSPGPPDLIGTNSSPPGMQEDGRET